MENTRVVRTNDNEETKRSLSEISSKIDSFVQNIEKQLTENVDKTQSTVNELEKAFDTKVTQLNDRCSQISDALETITELIKQQQTKETRSQECQTEKVITVTVDTSKSRKRKRTTEHNRTFHHTTTAAMKSEKQQITSHRLRSNSTSASSSSKKVHRSANLRMQFQRRRLAEMTNHQKSLHPSRMGTRSSPRIERSRAKPMLNDSRLNEVESRSSNRSILSSSSSEIDDSELISVQDISGYVNHHSTPLKPLSSPEQQHHNTTRRTPKRYIEFTSESDTE